MAGNEMCYLGEMLWGYRLVFTPISALRSNSNTELYCRSWQRATEESGVRGRREEEREKTTRDGKWAAVGMKI